MQKDQDMSKHQDQSRYERGWRGGLSLYTATEPTFDLAGVIGFYAGLSFTMEKETFLEASKRIRFPVLGLFGGGDSFIPAKQLETNGQEFHTRG